jgi:hypothetical protein
MMRTRSAELGILFLLALAVMVGGCSESGGPTGDDEGEEELGKPPAPMVASWTYQSVTEDGSAAALADALDWDAAAVEARVHVMANGAYYYEEVNGSGGQLSAESGWVFVDEEGPTIEFHIQLTDAGVVDQRFTVTYAISGTTMTLTQSVSGSTLVYTLTK